MAINGVGSQSQIEQLLYLEAEPLRRLEARQAGFDVRLGVLSDLRSKINNFKSLVADFAETGSESALRAFNVGSSHESLVTATASSSASPANHTINVTQLAKANTLASTGLQGDAATSIGAGTYTFDITADGTTTGVTVTVNDGDTNADVLKRVADEIRAAGVEVYGSVVTSDTSTNTQNLVLSAKETGLEASITAISDTSGGLMAALGLTDVAAATSQAAQDAQFTLDGIQISSGSNAVEGVLEGVVLNLNSADETIFATIKVEVDREGLKSKMDELFGAYNDIMSYLNSKLSSGDETGSGRGDLAGDLTFISFRNQMKLDLARRVSDTYARDGINSLDDVGLTLSREGTLSLDDEEQFFNSLLTTPDAVEAYFGSEDGIFSRLEEMVSGFTKIGGGLDLSKDQVESRKDVLDLRIERQQGLLELRERQLREEFGRLSQFVAQIGAQQSALGSLFGSASTGG